MPIPSFHETADIDADPETAWSVLGDLASIDRWLPGTASVERDGMTRVCRFEDGRVQHEQISHYSPEQRSFCYAVEGGLPVMNNRGHVAVEARPCGSRIVWESSFEPLDPTAEAELSGMWRSALPVLLGDLKQLVEGAAT